MPSSCLSVVEWHPGKRDNFPVSTILPINADDLLRGRSIESVRVEFKASWNPDTTGFQVLKTTCAFANDFQNLNGGYVVIGVAESEGRAVRPPVGLTGDEIDSAQRWIRGRCTAMRPSYTPILSPEVLDGRDVLVVWAPASEERPHRAPDGPAASRSWKYWIRVGSETVDADASGRLDALLEQAVRMPWDNRAAHGVGIESLREATVREHLHDVGSALLGEPDAATIYRRMRITAPVNEHEAPRNVGLLFFSHEPEQWFTGARIAVAQFAADRAGEVVDERVFRGTLVAQLRACLLHLEGLSQTHIKKQRDRSRVRGWVSYPMQALREVLVNAVYHRSYRPEVMEPTKVLLYPDRMEVVSYPGPVAGIEPHHLAPGASIPPTRPRNPRIGEFLKQLGLAEEWLTGLPRIFRSMEENGSPLPRFDFDPERTWFRATLPAHPEYVAISTLQDAAYLRTVGELADAFRRVRDSWRANRGSAVLAVELIRLHAEREELEEAEAVFARFRKDGSRAAIPNVANTWIEVLLDHGRESDARRLLDEIAESTSAQDAIDAAILARRLRESRIAHRYFQQAGDAIWTDPRALQEFAQTKLWLAHDARRKRSRGWHDVNRRLLVEARGLLERVVSMDASPTRHAWAWRDLARTLNWLRAPASEVEAAFERAIGLLPDEPRFAEELNHFRDRQRERSHRPAGSRRNGRRSTPR